MKSYWKSVLFSFLFLSSLLSAAQEICNNGVDDDGDGLIDCYDGDCSNDGACDDFFFGNQVICADEIDVTSFAMRLQWGSEDRSANSHATPMVGDLDGNGIPEVVTTNKHGRSVYVLNGATGATIASTTFGWDPENAPVLGDVDNDEFGEILVSQDQGDDMIMFNHDLTILWSGKASKNDAIGLPGFADFDGDGDVEIYYRNEVVNAATGAIIIAGSNVDWEREFTHGSLAVDIFPAGACTDCEGLELVSGNEIWSINEATGTRTLVADMDDDIHTNIASNLNYYPKYYSSWDDQWSSVSAADYNLDGNIDLIITGALGTSSETYTGETTIFFWDVANGNVITYHDSSNDFVRGPGRVNIGDVDGDGQLNANFVMNQKLYSLDENFNVHWIHPIKEGSSGFTGCSLFDFDGDGAVEVVYRSEESLLIIDGVGNGDNTTSERREIACVSRTQEEYPVIADVDGDGASEICVTCYFNNSTPFGGYGNSEFAHVRVYESDGEAWMPARGVWNQHGYYNVNINDDLTIPRVVQDPTLISSTGCEYADGTPIPFEVFPLNTFINQAPILNDEGCVEFASPDIDFVGIVSATDALCPDAEITVEFEITNTGDIGISGNLPVSYYAGDPTADPSSSVLLDTEVTFITNFEVGQTLTLSQTIAGIGGDFELFVVINDAGGTPPISVPLPTASIPECDTENNMQSTLVGSQSFELTVEKLFDNRKCDLTKPNNGQARAYYFGPAPGPSENIWVENFQDRTSGAKSDTDETAWTSDGGSETPSFYGVDSYSGSNMFRASGTGTSNDVGVVTWTSQEIDISNYSDIGVTVDIFENGNQESSGQWRDWVRVSYELRDASSNVIQTNVLGNGYQDGDFTYAQAIVGNLSPDGSAAKLVIIAEIHNTSSTEHHYIDNIIVDGTGPDVTAEYTEPDGFVFRWYNDDDYSTVIYEGSQYPQMATGTYDVVGYYGATQCYSDTVEVDINLVAPVLYGWTYQISAETDCNNPNGSLGAFVYTTTLDGTFPASDSNPPQDTLLTGDGFEFVWTQADDGTNTPIATGEIISDLRRIGSGYNVFITDNLTGCQTNQTQNVESSLTKPTDINVFTTDITACGGTGEISADVSGTTAGFTFYWYDGPNIKPTADFVGDTYIVSDPGDFTLIVEDNATGCQSETPITTTINDNSVAPNPTTTLVQNNTSCVAGNGIVRADGDGAGTVAGFTFEWFLGANTLPANALPGSAAPGAFLVSDNPFELGGLEESTYTVRVTDNSTSCVETRTVSVADTPGSLSVTPGNLIQNDINSCNAAVLGSIDASGVVPGDVNDVSIGNINSSFETPDILTNNNHAQSFNGGRIKTYNQSFIDGWSTTAPDQRIEIWHNNNTTSGNPDAYHGDQFAEINANSDAALYFDLATVPGSLLNWSFAHKGRAGTDVLSVNIGEPGAEVVQGNFSTGSAAWAFYEGEYTIPADQFTTRFQFEAVSTAGGNNTVGNFVDTVSFVMFPYRFELYEGATVSGNADYINTTGQFGDLDEGDYVLVVYDNLTGCGAVEIPITIVRDETQPMIATSVTDDAHCDNDDGSVDVTASMSTSEPASYTYEIFDGHSFTTQIGPDETVNDGSSPFTFSNLAPGDYRIRVTNDDTQCTSFEDVVVDDITVTPTFSTSQVIDNSSCDPGNPNGFLAVSIQGDVVSNYTFTWWQGTDTSVGAYA
ncbi:FG-GAP-like repeat-containing protein, partial [Ekhidna sp.]|uniref:FG-GAP-like repeat-containing protein n=1 Tax=Ekhidna sp. TaxID=2608089 RepID=UPI0035145BEB